MSCLGTYLGVDFVTSSYSHPGDCVAVALPRGGGAAVKDSKDPQGAVLEFSREAWAAFLADIPTDA